MRTGDRIDQYSPDEHFWRAVTEEHRALRASQRVDCNCSRCCADDLADAQDDALSVRNDW